MQPDPERLEEESDEAYGQPPTREDYALELHRLRRRYRRLEEALAILLAAKDAGRYVRRLPDEQREVYRRLEREAWVLARRAWEERDA